MLQELQRQQQLHQQQRPQQQRAIADPPIATLLVPVSSETQSATRCWPEQLLLLLEQHRHQTQRHHHAALAAGAAIASAVTGTNRGNNPDSCKCSCRSRCSRCFSKTDLHEKYSPSGCVCLSCCCCVERRFAARADLVLQLVEGRPRLGLPAFDGRSSIVSVEDCIRHKGPCITCYCSVPLRILQGFTMLLLLLPFPLLVVLIQAWGLQAVRCSCRSTRGAQTPEGGPPAPFRKPAAANTGPTERCRDAERPDPQTSRWGLRFAAAAAAGSGEACKM